MFEIAVVNEPSVVEPPKFYCMMNLIRNLLAFVFIFFLAICRRKYCRLLFRAFINPLYTGVHCHCFMLSAPICRLRSVNSILFSSILMVILLANTVDPDQTPH